MSAMRRFTLLAMGVGLGSMACAGEVSVGLLAAVAGNGPVGCGDSYLAATESSMSLDAQLDTPGATPAVVFEMFMSFSQPPGPILLTRQAVFTLPAEFGFLGFDALGGPGPIQVGQWDFDYTNPGNGVFDPLGPFGYDYRIPHFAIDANTAYADSLPNDSYDAGTDAIATHSLGPGGTHVLTLVLPSGATNNNGFGGNCSYFDTDVRFTLPAGILQLPQAAGSYDVTVVATSVDPDTGDADDQQGTPPTVYQRTIPVTVPEPAAGMLGAAAIAVLVGLRRRAVNR
jgi:hypothetical protein